MPWIFSLVLSWVAKFFGTRVLAVAYRMAILAALIVILLALLNGFLSVVHSSLDTVSATVPDLLSMVWSWLMPGNVKACLTVIIAARIAKFYFSLSTRILIVKAKAVMGGAAE